MDIENVWNGLKVEKKLGNGSYGSVFKCCKEINGKKEYSAVKVISVPQEDITDESSYISIDGMSADESREYYKEIINDLMSEIKILESLKDSPNIVHIYDYRVFQKPDGIGWQIFIQMELLTDFNTYSADKELKENDIIKLGLDLCDALLACEKKKIIHRDIKPENIFIDDYGNFKLGDFGVAKQLERTEASMSRKGTYNYMAPEVLMAKKYDSRADIYSLGIVMYKLLNNNRMPFIDPEKKLVKYAEREEAYERRMAGEKIPPLKDVSEGLNAIILRACEFKPEYRFGNISELKTAIEKVSKGRAIKAKAWLKRNKLKCIIAASVAVVIAVLSVLGVYLFRTKSGNLNQPESIFEQIAGNVVDDKSSENVYHLISKNVALEIDETHHLDGVYFFNVSANKFLSYSSETLVFKEIADRECFWDLISVDDTNKVVFVCPGYTLYLKMLNAESSDVSVKDKTEENEQRWTFDLYENDEGQQFYVIVTYKKDNDGNRFCLSVNENSEIQLKNLSELDGTCFWNINFEEIIQKQNSDKNITDATTEKTDTTKTEAETKQNALSNDSNTKFLVANGQDESNLEKYLAFILGYGNFITNKNPLHGYYYKEYFDYNYKPFNYTSSDAFEYAFGCVAGCHSYSFVDFLSNLYGWESKSFCESHKGADPLNKFEVWDGAYYVKYNGQKVDEIIKVFFNTNPDHDYEITVYNDYSKKNEIWSYYSNDSYYVRSSQGGDGAGPKVKIYGDTMKLDSNGKYNISVEYLWGNDDGYSHVSDIDVTAKLIDFNGDRVWSFYKIVKA